MIAVVLAALAPARAAWAQDAEPLCVQTDSRSRALTTGQPLGDPGDDPEPALCDQRHWQTILIFTGLVNTGFAWAAGESLVSGERLSRRALWAMFAVSAPQAIFGARFLADDLSDGNVDLRDLLLLGSTLVSTAVATYSGWSLLRHGQEAAHPVAPGIRVGAAPLRDGVMLGASGRF